MATSDDNSSIDANAVGADDASARTAFVVSRAAVGCACASAVAAVVFVVSLLVLLEWPTTQNMRTADDRFAAISLLRGEPLITAKGEKYGKTPPIYPVALAGLRLLGFEWWTCVGLINALAFAAGVLAVHGLARLLGLRTSRWLVLAYLCFGPIYYMFREARPDIIFAVCGIGGVALATAYAHRRTLPLLLALAVICSLAALSRYMAILTLLPLAGVVILLARHGSWSRKAAHVALFCLIAGGPIVGWLIRTERVTQHYTGMDRWRDRKPADETLTTFDNNVRFMARAFYIDFLAWEDFAQLNVLKGTHEIEHEGVVVLITCALVLILAGIAVARRRAVRNKLRAWLLRSGRPRTALLITAAYILLYQAMMLVLWTVGNNDPIDCRFLAPSYFLLVVLGATLLTVLWRAGPGLLSRGAVVAAAAGFLTLQTWKTAATWEIVSDNSASPWVEDPDQFLEAMGKKGIEARIEDRLAERGRTKGIPARMQKRLENRGKVLDPTEQKTDRVQELAERIRNDPTRKQKPPEQVKADTGKNREALMAERRRRREAEAEKKQRDSAAGDGEPDAIQADAEGQPAEPPTSLPPLEYVRLSPPSHWTPYVPATPLPTLLAAFHLGEAQRGKDRGFVQVFQMESRSNADPDPFKPWLAGFVGEEEGERFTPTSTALRIHGIPVRMVELTGKFRSDDPENPQGTCSLIAAEFRHPRATVVVVALGPRKIVADEQDVIVAYLMSAESLEPIAPPPPPPTDEASADDQPEDPSPAETPDGAPSVVAPVDEPAVEAPPPAAAAGPEPPGASTDDPPADDGPLSRSVTFAFEPPWEVYAPKNAGDGFRQGFFLDPQDRTRASAKLVVTHIPTHSPDHAAQIARWLKDFTVLEKHVVHDAPTPARGRIGLPVAIVEAAGTYAPPTWATPVPDYFLIGAVIVLRDGMYTVKATGPRTQIEAQRAKILAFIGSGRGDAGEGALIPEAVKPAQEPPHDAPQK